MNDELLDAVRDYIRIKESLHEAWSKRHDPTTHYTERLIKEEFPAYERLKQLAAKEF